MSKAPRWRSCPWCGRVQAGRRCACGASAVIAAMRRVGSLSLSPIPRGRRPHRLRALWSSRALSSRRPSGAVRRRHRPARSARRLGLLQAEGGLQPALRGEGHGSRGASISHVAARPCAWNNCGGPLLNQGAAKHLLARLLSQTGGGLFCASRLRRPGSGAAQAGGACRRCPGRHPSRERFPEKMMRRLRGRERLRR